MGTRTIRLKIIGDASRFKAACSRASFALRKLTNPRLRRICVALDTMGDEVRELSWRWPNCRWDNSPTVAPAMTNRQLRRMWERKHR